MRKHAEPTRVTVSADQVDGDLIVSVANDGANSSGTDPGIGLRLLSLEALRHGCAIEHRPAGGEGWETRLIIPDDVDSGGSSE